MLWFHQKRNKKTWGPMFPLAALNLITVKVLKPSGAMICMTTNRSCTVAWNIFHLGGGFLSHEYLPFDLRLAKNRTLNKYSKPSGIFEIFLYQEVRYVVVSLKLNTMENFCGKPPMVVIKTASWFCSGEIFGIRLLCCLYNLLGCCFCVCFAQVWAWFC